VKQVIFLVQIIVASLLVLTILIQQKGTGLGGTFGGELAFYRTKRGAERLLFYLTTFLAFLFIASSIVGLVIL